MKANIIYLLSLLLINITSSNIYAQTNSVSGIIVDQITNEPIPYASVGIVDSFEGTATNIGGVFEIKTLCIVNCRIKISTIGYRSKTINLIKTDLDTIKLTPAATVLQGVMVTSRNINARKVVRKAFRKIRKNYITEPFTMKVFYRQYTYDNGSYTRLLEAACDIYRDKGYHKPKDIARSRFNLKMTQLRRSFDQSNHGSRHKIKTVLAQDLAAYQSIGNYHRDFYFGSPSNIKRFMKNYEFEVEKINEVDGDEIFIISFKTSHDNAIKTGKLYITSKNQVIVKYEINSATCQNITHNNCYQWKSIVQYKKFNHKYALFHVTYDWIRTTLNKKHKHVEHAELLNNQIILGENDNLMNSEINRKDMASIQYDSTFWANFNTIKTNPLEASIVESLQKSNSLTTQFEQQQYVELASIEFEEESVTKLKNFMASNTTNPYYLIFWASWDKSFFKEFEQGKPYMEKLKANGVKFLFVSIDNNHSNWEKTIPKFPSEYSNHIRVGRSLDRGEMFGFYGHSRSLFYKDGILHNARSPAIVPEVFEDVLKEHFNN